LEKGDALSPLLLNFTLEYAIRGIQANLKGLKLNGTNQLLVYTDVNILDGRIHAIRKNKEALVVDGKVEVNAEETKYMVEQFKYLRTTITN
jgi:hypothetical protein